MATWKPASLAMILAACQAGPTSPAGESPQGFVAELSPEAIATGLFLSVPGQLVSVEQGIEVEQAWVSAHLTAGTDRVPISDGAILVVSAADGPMPQTDPEAETLSIEVRSAVVDDGGVVLFGGLARLATGREVSPPFEISGMARPAAAPPASSPSGPDYIVWDIVGGNVLAPLTFTTRTVVRSR